MNAPDSTDTTHPVSGATVAASPEGVTLRRLKFPQRLWVPIGLTGDASAPTVAEGRAVLRGDALVDAPVVSGFVPRAPVAGVTGRVVETILLGGSRIRAMELRCTCDRADEEETGDVSHVSDEQPSRTGEGELTEWTSRLAGAGIWADRVNSPDLLGQLHQALRRPVDTVVCSLIDADPAMRLNAVVARRFAVEVVEAVELIGRVVGAKRQVLAVEAEVPQRWWGPVRRAVRDKSIRLSAVHGGYPAGDTTLLLQRVVDRKLRPGRSPVEVGTIVFDAVTAVAVGRLVRRGRSMLQTPLGVVDHRTGQTTYAIAAVGTRLGDVLRELSIDLSHTALRTGDLLRDRLTDEHAVVGGGEVVVHVTHDDAPTNPQACIRCGWCVDACPTGVHPAAVLGAAQSLDTECGRRFGMDACIGCGLCTYVCPSQLPILHGIRQLSQIKPDVTIT